MFVMTVTKRILTAIVLVFFAFSLILPVSAAQGSFVQSPSSNLAPEIVDNGDSDDKFEITSYADRDKLPEEDREALEKAYKKITSVKILTGICGGLKKLAEKENIPAANLAVSDLFDISAKDVNKDGRFDIVIKAETLENFVALLHYKDGKFELVEDAKVIEKDGELHLTFSVDGLSPFAIVVDTGEELPSDKDNVIIIVLVIIVAAEAAALISILIKFIVTKKTAAK